MSQLLFWYWCHKTYFATPTPQLACLPWGQRCILSHQQCWKEIKLAIWMSFCTQSGKTTSLPEAAKYLRALLYAIVHWLIKQAFPNKTAIGEGSFWKTNLTSILSSASPRVCHTVYIMSRIDKLFHDRYKSRISERKIYCSWNSKTRNIWYTDFLISTVRHIVMSSTSHLNYCVTFFQSQSPAQ